MQIFSLSHNASSSKPARCARGFTLVELLVSIGVIGIVTAIVLIRYSSFDSTVLLKNEAYEVALALREAQVKSVGAVRAGSPSGAYAYGVSFDESNAYRSFIFRSSTEHPEYEALCSGTSDTECAETLIESAMDRTMRIMDLCIERGSDISCGIDRLDVSFRRPEFRSLFSTDSSSIDVEDITAARIVLGSPTGPVRFVVEVTSLGQISVYPDET